MGQRWAWWVVMAAAVLLAVPAQGHQTDRAEQQTEVRAESGEVEHLYSLSAHDLLHHLGELGHDDEVTQEILDEHRGALKDYIDEHTLVEADGEACERGESAFVFYPGDDGRVHYHQEWECAGGAEEIEIHNRVMLDMHHGGYRHMARIQMGDEIYPTVFDPSYPSYSVYPGEGAAAETDGVEVVDEGEEAVEERGGFGWTLVVALIAVVVGTLVWWVRRR